MLTKNENNRYVYILADGSIREKVEEGAEGAVLRKWETRDGKSGEKWERVFDKIENVLITNVQIDQGDYGEQIQLTLSDGEDEIILTQSVATRFGEDLLKKVPAILFEEKLTIAPYSFTGDDGKEKRGVNIYQKSDKVLNFFFDPEKKVAINGYPEPTEEDRQDWPFFYKKANKFLVKFCRERIIPKFVGVSSSETGLEEEFAKGDVPF